MSEQNEKTTWYKIRYIMLTTAAIMVIIGFLLFGLGLIVSITHDAGYTQGYKTGYKEGYNKCLKETVPSDYIYERFHKK